MVDMLRSPWVNFSIEPVAELVMHLAATLGMRVRVPSGSPIFEKDYIMSTELTTEEKAELFDALLNQERIRVLGCAGLGKEKYQHIGIEMWTKHLGSGTKEIDSETERGREILITYLKTQASALRKNQ